MMQNVQRWSQPCWISIYALDLPSNFSIVEGTVFFSNKISSTCIGLEKFKSLHTPESNFSLFPKTKSTSFIVWYFLGLIWAAHPVTIILFSGLVLFAFRISYATFFSASAVTAHEFITVTFFILSVSYTHLTLPTIYSV